MVTEGVIRFHADHAHAPLDTAPIAGELRALMTWRQRLHEAGLIGRDPARYDGAAYGNVSVRLCDTGPTRPFLITGTQTSGHPRITEADLCVVQRWELAQNRVQSCGPALPSSEAMTHGALYDLGRGIRFVFHVHCPQLWRRAKDLGLPVTDPAAEYGTTGMAEEARRLVRDNPGVRLIAMGGHEDGVLGFGPTGHAAGTALLDALRAAGG